MKKTLFKPLILTIFTASFAGGFTAISATADSQNAPLDESNQVVLQDTDRNGFYEISNADDLYAFSTVVNDGQSTINVEFTDNIVVNENVLTESGELNGDGSSFRTWIPAGIEEFLAYEGNIKGNGKVISGLYYSGEDPFAGLIGFAGYMANISNLGIEDSYFYSTATNEEGTGIGGIVGTSVNNVTINGCHFQGILKAPNAINVGGVCGMLQKNSIVKNSYVLADIKGDVTVGGIVGYCTYSDIEKSYHVGKTSGTRITAGVVGQLYTASAKSCYAIGKNGSSVKVLSTGFYQTLENCYYQADKEKDNSTQTTFKTVEQIANGEICRGVGFHTYHTQASACGTACSLCSEIIGEATHVWNDGEITKAPTCSEVGEKTFTCTHNDKHTRTEEIAIDENAHVWNDGEITKEPTATEKGIKTFTCANNDEHTKTEELPVKESAAGCGASLSSISFATIIGAASIVFMKKKKD